jgi:hypothetical protein
MTPAPVPQRTTTLTGLAALLVLLVACTGGAGPEGSAQATPSPTASPTPTSAGEPLTQAQLKYRLVDTLGAPWFCDPDEYPVARGDEAVLAFERFDEIHGDAEAFAAIIEHLGLNGRSSFTADQKLAIYRQWKALNAILLEADGEASFRFDYLALPAEGEAGARSTGSIDAAGAISIDRQVAAGEPNCPICLSRGTQIATQLGPIAVQQLAIGDLVWSKDTTGRRIAVPILRVGSAPVPGRHQVVRLQLDDGRALTASPGHPLADGRRLGELRIGDRIAGAAVVSATTRLYRDGFTFDLLPSGPTGVYWADGILLGSTLDAERPPPRSSP